MGLKKRGNENAEHQRHQFSVTTLTEEVSNGTALRPLSTCLSCGSRRGHPVQHLTVQLTEAQRRAGRATPKNNLTYTLHFMQALLLVLSQFSSRQNSEGGVIFPMRH